MGSAFSLGVVTDTEEQANALLQMGVDEIKRIENLLSEFLTDSETSLINQQAAIVSTPVSRECFHLLQRCQAISKLSNGGFDITVGPLKKLYHFNNGTIEFPDEKIIKETLHTVGYKKMALNKDNYSVRLNHPETTISFAAIGKGYASDRVKKLWQTEGLSSGYINASGDLNAFGQKADGTPWKIAIADPDDTSKVLLYVPLQNASLATSGDYEQFFIHEEKRYSHNINPHTGLPLSGIKSVSVFSPSAELSDALATAVYVKGVVKGLHFANQLPDTHCVIIDDENQIHLTKDLRYEKVADF